MQKDSSRTKLPSRFTFWGKYVGLGAGDKGDISAAAA